MAWTKPLFDRPRFNSAGHTLLDDSLDEMRKEQELSVVNNWRSAHGYPLQVIKMTLKQRAIEIDRSAIIAQRLKRLPSILSKLRREKSMKLTQMQDIGGCRAVLSSIAYVDRLVASYQKAKIKNPTGRHEQTSIKDYIACPKADGYRGVHLIYKYRSRSSEHKIYTDQKVEIQIRTKLQHAWATAVEIVDAFTGQALKSDVKLNMADPDWRRFFALMGDAIALREKRPIVPGTPMAAPELKRELQDLANKLRVDTLLSGLKSVTNYATVKSENTAKNAAYLISLNLAQKTVRVIPFTHKELLKANDEYLRIEKENESHPDVLSVLVAVESINALKTAYPNYYLDSTVFLEALKTAIQ